MAPSRPNQDNILSSTEKSLVATRLRQLQTVASNRLADRFQHIWMVDNDAILSIILLLTPNVEGLTIKHAIFWARTHGWLLLAMAHPVQPSHLKDVTIYGKEVKVENLQALLMLPSLRTLPIEHGSPWLLYHELRPQYNQWNIADQEIISAYHYDSRIEHLHLGGRKLDLPS